jgi:ribosomal protein S18 acetylase RimI-like enzyme
VTEVLRRGREAARVGPWRGARATALLAPAPGAAASVSPSFLLWCCDRLASRGFDRVVSAALLPGDTHAYRAAGFELFEELHLLSRGLDRLPVAPPSNVQLVRGRRRDLEPVVAIDQQAFQPFWRFDADGITEARTITPRARFRVAFDEDGHHAGYAVTGLGEEQGYLQRLAVAPERQGRGIGSRLVIDGLNWLARRRAVRVMVNTQVSNDNALALYLHLGFHLEGARLEVLSLELR